MLQSLTIAVVAIFLCVTAAVLAFGQFVDKRREQARVLHDRLKAIQQANERAPSEELALLRDELLSGIPSLNKLLARSARVSRLQKFLSQDDLKIRAGKFLLLALGIAVCLAMITELRTNSPFIALVMGGVGLLVPFGYASFRRSRRFAKFEQLFPEAIDLLGRAVRAGHAFTTALELIGDELAEPVGGEFRKLFEEQKFGLPVRDALLNLADRVPLIDVKFFVTAVMLQRETGGNLAEILDNLSYVIRERFKILRQVRTHTAQGRLTMYILMALPPSVCLMMVLTNPDFIKPLFHDPAGHMLVGLAIILQTIGYFLIRKIIHIRV